MKVDFMIIGAMKAGTTTLYKILREHPGISFSKVKETNFFSRTPNWKEELPKYHKLFIEGKGKLYGEASPSYTSYPKTGEIWNNIYDYNPKMKIIYLVRNPLERSISHYMHVFEHGYNTKAIDVAFKDNSQLIDRSRYFFQIKPYIDLFGKKQVMLIDFDDFIHERESVMQQLATFLGIDYNLFTPFENVHANKSVGDYRIPTRLKKYLKYVNPITKRLPEKLRFRLRKLVSKPKKAFKDKPVLPIGIRKKMIKIIQPEIPELERLLEKDLSKWFN